ncbi:carbohydrate esterase family 4 protein [Pholiota conissans]|uniref:chitin deacetylase n=1 Tax=Pholiota conissans TaxID=109636 RepID=A0A9P6CTH6_9AGAR|nr:carbohydrate esterase family 4 protein [Pholiota conissans]
MLPSSSLFQILSIGALSTYLFQGVHADRTNEAGEAQITDPDAECTPYGFPLVSNALPTFPTPWTPATILPGDSAAMAKWNSIQGSIPNIAPKGTLTGNFSTVHYTADDPDCWWTFNNCVTPKAPGLVPDIAIMPEPQTLGYGFDDGPNCSHNAFYDYLTSQNQKATMFYIGSNVMYWPLEAQRGLTDGHEICVHTWSHKYMTSFSSQDAFAELYYSSYLHSIKLVVGVTPTCWRPPYGDVDDRIRAIAKGLGLRTILWKYDSDDWQFGSKPGVTQDTVEGNYQNLINDANKGTFSTAGAIILTHEINAFTMSEAIKMYPLLRAAFKNIVPVGVGYNVSQPYVETNFTLPSFDQCKPHHILIHLYTPFLIV